MSKKETAIRTLVIFIISLSLICVTLYAGRNVVLTNNGDFNRVSKLCSLVNDGLGGYKINLTEEDYWKNIDNILNTPEDTSGYPSCQLGFVRFSVAVSYSINYLCTNPSDTYNPVCLSFMFALMYALSLTFALMQINIKNKYLHYLTVAVSVLMMCDIGYVSYFNSLYGEGLQHIFLVASVGFVIRAWKKRLNIFETLIFVVFLILFGQAKFFNIPFAIIIALFAFFISLRHSPDKRSLLTGIASVVLLISVLINTYTTLPEWISKETNYNSVFYGVVKDCDDDTARKYLKELGLDSDMYVLKNTHHYVSNFAQIKENYDAESAETISKVKLLMFYAKNPLVACKKISDIANHSAHIRNIFFMDENFMDDMSNCVIWSRLRENLGFDTVLLNFVVMIAFLVLLIVTFTRNGTKKYITVISSLLVFAAFAYTFFIPYVSNGEADLAKHMYLYIELIDICLIAILVMSIHLPRRLNRVTGAVLAIAFVINLMPYNRFDKISFAGYDWYVIDETEAYKTLIASQAVAFRSYDNNKSNLYSESDVHSWLNNEFIESFTQTEKGRLFMMEQKIPVSAAFVSQSDSGNRDFYCSAFPERVVNNYDTSYGQAVSGYAFLPGADHISLMAKKGLKTSISDKYWLSTPYFNSSEKSRYVNPDGLVYFDYTNEKFGIRPVIYLKK